MESNFLYENQHFSKKIKIIQKGKIYYVIRNFVRN